jgi:hypothetical protein
MGRLAGICVALACGLTLNAITAATAAEPGSGDHTASVSAQACGKAAAREALKSFVAAFNRGDYERLDALFAPRPAFQWYSQNGPGQRIGAKAKDRESLIPYFRARHRVGDRLGLIALQANTGTNRKWNFGLLIRRSVPGFLHGEWFRVDAKGAVECGNNGTAIVVLSFGSPQEKAAKGRARS